MNEGIEDDIDDPKEAAHHDYKYLRSFEGPMARSENKANGEDREKEKLLKKKKPVPKVLASFERKKFGGIRMC